MNGIPKLTLILNPVTFDYAAGKTTNALCRRWAYLAIRIYIHGIINKALNPKCLGSRNCKSPESYA